jgi:predicted nuclease of predicted toxin-antitoxin system
VNFLIDHQLPPALVGFFRERGCESLHVSELGMTSCSDAEIFQYARANHQIIVTKDEDFFYLCRRLESDVSLLWVRLGNCRTSMLLTTFSQQWKEILGCFESGDRIVEIR